MSFKHQTPKYADNTELYYRDAFINKGTRVQSPKFGMLPEDFPPEPTIRNLLNLASPDLVIIQIRLYRFFRKLYEEMKIAKPQHYSGLVEKTLVYKEFSGNLNKVKILIGRVLKVTTIYDVHHQKNASENPTGKCIVLFRFMHPLDIVYGLEHAMCLWLPKLITKEGGLCKTQEDFKEELDLLYQQDKTEDLKLASSAAKHQLM